MAEVQVVSSRTKPCERSVVFSSAYQRPALIPSTPTRTVVSPTVIDLALTRTMLSVTVTVIVPSPLSVTAWSRSPPISRSYPFVVMVCTPGVVGSQDASQRSSIGFLPDWTASSTVGYSVSPAFATFVSSRSIRYVPSRAVTAVAPE